MGRRKKKSPAPAEQVQAEPEADEFFSMQVESAPKELSEQLTQEQYPVPCTLSSIGAAFSGGALGYVFGFGQQMLKHKGKGRLKASNVEGFAGAKSFAFCTGVYALTSCVLQRIRQQDDAWNGAVGGCASGLVIAWGGTPLSTLSSCIIAGALSYFVSANEVSAAEATARQYQVLQPASRLSQQCGSVCRVQPGRRSMHQQMHGRASMQPVPSLLCLACRPDPVTAALAAPWRLLWALLRDQQGVLQHS